MYTKLYSLWLVTLISCGVKACAYTSWLLRTRLVTASVGDDAIFNYFTPIDGNLSYFVQWARRIEQKDTPILAWHETDLTHTGTGYEGRAFRITNTSYGVTAFNLTNITNSDRGKYTFTLIKQDSDYLTKRRFYLLVNVPPYFIKTSPKNIFAELGDKIVLTCKAEGIPLPEIFWYKDSKLVNSSATFDLFTNDMELRISNISHEDIGTYTCVAQNGEEDQNLQTSHTMKMFLTTILTNQIKLEGENVEILCDIKTKLENDTVNWFRDEIPIEEVSFLKERVERRANSLFINSVNFSDSGQYSCQVSDGVGEPRSTSTYLIVKHPPTKTSISSVQYLPLGLSGMLHCNTNASISRMNVTWTKDKRFLEPSKNIVMMKNASVFFAQVNEHHEGLYTCTDWYEVKVLVRKPPTFTITPKDIYHGKLGEIMSIHCDAQGGDGMEKPTIQWKKQDGRPLLETTIRTNGGTLTFRKLGYFDFGFYQCVASNEVATIVATTLVTVSDTPPQPPFNLNGVATESEVTLSWTPGFGFGFSQRFVIRYREAGVSEWNTTYVPFPRPGGPRNERKIKKLSSGTLYEFKVGTTSTLGSGMSSEILSVRTQEE